MGSCFEDIDPNDVHLNSVCPEYNIAVKLLVIGIIAIGQHLPPRDIGIQLHYLVKDLYASFKFSAVNKQGSHRTFEVRRLGIDFESLFEDTHALVYVTFKQQIDRK